MRLLLVVALVAFAAFLGVNGQEVTEGPVEPSSCNDAECVEFCAGVGFGTGHWLGVPTTGICSCRKFFEFLASYTKED